jgi:membrane-associated phospholipid phosphatase
MNARWWLPLLLLAIAAPLWLHWWEPQLFLAINQACASVPAVAWAAISLGGNAWGVLALTSPLLVFAPRLMWAWLCAAPVGVLFARIGKEWLFSPRPAGLIEHAQIRIVGEPMELASMPSGHTLTAFAVVGSIYFAIDGERRRRFVWLWLLAALVGLSRIALGAHWPGDVAVGACLGMWAAAIGHLLWARLGPDFFSPLGWRMRALAALLALTLYHMLEAPLDYDESRQPQYVLALVLALVLLRFARLQRRLTET